VPALFFTRVSFLFLPLGSLPDLRGGRELGTRSVSCSGYPGFVSLISYPSSLWCVRFFAYCNLPPQSFLQCTRGLPSFFCPPPSQSLISIFILFLDLSSPPMRSFSSYYPCGTPCFLLCCVLPPPLGFMTQFDRICSSPPLSFEANGPSWVVQPRIPPPVSLRFTTLSLRRQVVLSDMPHSTLIQGKFPHSI